MNDDLGLSTTRRQALFRLAATAGASALGACTTAVVQQAQDDWHDVLLPGKRRTEYRWESTAAGRVLLAQADGSASMFRRHVVQSGQALGQVGFAWWVQSLPEGGDVSDAHASDAAARVMFAFGGDHARLTARDQMTFELSRLLTGEAPPFATLAYVWDTAAPLGRVVVHPRTDRVRKIVVESGRGGLRQWKRYSRPLVADYTLAFGEAPGPLLAVAVMTDGDNTRSRLTTRYRDITF